jgi:uncharacterized protein YegL
VSRRTSSSAVAADRPETAAAAAALLEELAGLVRLAARRGDLVVVEGEPDSPWSFNWATGVISVNPGDLRSLAPDLCRGLALHEASHAAVTVLQQFVPRADLVRLMPLLNVIEDIRIEIWMRARFPGAIPWIRAYNDVFYGRLRRGSLPRSCQVQFLRGILELWWYGAPTPGMHPQVLHALAFCRESIAAAVACQPPLDDDPPAVLAAQRGMWDIVRTRIVPVWDRLVRLDRRAGIGPLAAQELERFAETLAAGTLAAGCDGTTCRRLPRRGSRRRRRTCGTSRRRPVPSQPAAGTTTEPRHAPTSDDVRQQIAAGLGHGDNDAYLTAWKRIAPSADRLGDELLRRLVPRQRLRWTAGHPSGSRLDLRRAVRFEADPTLYQSLWSRPVLPHRRDPAVILLLDRSGSMQGQRMAGAFEGLVLMVEVCRRIGVPAAVWSFANHCRRELDWDSPLDPSARRRLSVLRDSSDGQTAMAPALDAVRRAFQERHGDPKLLFVIGDGAPDQPRATLSAVRRLEADGIGTIGLGLGPDTAGLARYFRQSVTGIPPQRLVDHVGRLLEATLLRMHGLAAAGCPGDGSPAAADVSSGG